MEENFEIDFEKEFEKEFEKLKEQDLNPEITRKYLLYIKRFINEIKESSEEELSEDQIKEIFDLEYKSDLRTQCEASNTYVALRKYGTCRKILELFKGNKNEFNRRIKVAKRLEENSGDKDDLPINFDYEKDIISALRGMLRKTKMRIYAGKSELELLKDEEQNNLKIAKTIMITSIQKDVAYLEKFGIIDEYIKESNKTLEKLNLSELKYIKRNPITDDEVEVVPDGKILPFKDEKGNEIKYSKEDSKVKEEDEDIGVIDNFSTENLEKLSIEDLLFLNAFWQDKAVEVSLEISKAKRIVSYLKIWDKIINEDEEAIKQLNLKDIKLGLKKDLALTYLSKDGIELTDSIVEKYIQIVDRKDGKEENEDDDKKLGKVKKIFKGNKVKKEQIKLKREEITNEINLMKDEVSSFKYRLADVMTLECTIVEKLDAKNFKTKLKWGLKAESINEDLDKNKEVVIVIENPNFRTPLIMPINKSSLRTFLEKDRIEFPVLKNELNDEYSNMDIYLPKSKYFSKIARKKYDENPSSSLNASIAGKKVKKEKNIESR